MKIKNLQRKKYTYRLPPCPNYDVEGTESWLSDMAKKGFLLSRDGFFAGLAIFEKAKPCTIRYRLEPISKKSRILIENENEPTDEVIALNESYGWSYIASRGQFYIYASSQLHARELNTDPAVQAIALNMVKKKERTNMIICFFWLMLYPILFLRGNLMLLAVHIGAWWALLSVLLFFWILWRSCARFLYLKKLKKRLTFGEMPNHKKDWKRHARTHQSLEVVFHLLIFTWLVLVFAGWSNENTAANVQSLNDYKGPIPFATMRDFAPNGTYHQNDLNLNNRYNVIKTRSRWLSPTMITFRENATIKLDGNKAITGGLLINYYDARSPWIAREIAREYVVEAKHSKNCTIQQIQDLGIDFSVTYTEIFPAVIIQQGNKVMQATFYQTSPSYTLELDEWAQILADSIK
ncbi:DUF2812 domain-containing protein [Sinanaerobacter sp. ZZT-01]|uniref:DUF2812 domain-containing protein n=1 Tax=Sinanaerobacter sp. ZZT-01 TaxID=3111540 RepID=UPI002D7A13AB|nr:DUF2812 domain-containing protein [Sinanaerobacter sp. ZZT-01]WRR94066.1 DUF2812 domain-containing protein [Sinanaerobacter sp. ZZT-01]